MSTYDISIDAHFVDPPFCLIEYLDLFYYIPPYSKKGGHSETLLNTCIAHSNGVHLLLSNNASDWLSGDFDKNQLKVSLVMTRSID